MCGSMVDIQSPTAEIRRGKKERKKKKETTGQKYNDLPYSIDGHNNGLRRNCASQMFGNRPPPAPTGRAQEECY